MDPSEKQAAHRGEKNTDFSDLRAVFFNCTLKHPDQASHTSLLMGSSARIMRKSGVAVDEIRMTAHDIAFGVQPDMREQLVSYAATRLDEVPAEALDALGLDAEEAEEL